MSDTPTTDAAKFVVSIFDHAVFKRYQTVTIVEHAEALERENNQLRADLKQCAEALKVADNAFHGSPSGQAIINKTLSLLSVQNALKGK